MFWGVRWILRLFCGLRSERRADVETTYYRTISGGIQTGHSGLLMALAFAQDADICGVNRRSELMSGDGAQRKCRHGSLRSALRGSAENICSP